MSNFIFNTNYNTSNNRSKNTIVNRNVMSGINMNYSIQGTWNLSGKLLSNNTNSYETFNLQLVIKQNTSDPRFVTVNVHQIEKRISIINIEEKEHIGKLDLNSNGKITLVITFSNNDKIVLTENVRKYINWVDNKITEFVGSYYRNDYNNYNVKNELLIGTTTLTKINNEIYVVDYLNNDNNNTMHIVLPDDISSNSFIWFRQDAKKQVTTSSRGYTTRISYPVINTKYDTLGYIECINEYTVKNNTVKCLSDNYINLLETTIPYKSSESHYLNNDFIIPENNKVIRRVNFIYTYFPYDNEHLLGNIHTLFDENNNDLFELYKLLINITERNLSGNVKNINLKLNNILSDKRLGLDASGIEIFDNYKTDISNNNILPKLMESTNVVMNEIVKNYNNKMLVSSSLSGLNYCEIIKSSTVTGERYDFIVVGGGPSGIMVAYNLSVDHPDKSILLVEKNKYTSENYKEDGYDKINMWTKSQNDEKYQYSFQTEDGKTVWVGKGLGGGTLHFGLQYIDTEEVIDKTYSEWNSKEDDNNIRKKVNNIVNADSYTYSFENNEYSPNEAWYKLKQSMDEYQQNSASDETSDRASLTTRDSWFFRRPFVTSNGILTATSSEDVKTFKSYNNKIYSKDVNTDERLLLSDLLKDKSNVTIQYGTAINKVLINLANNIYGIEDFSGNVYYADKTILCSGAIQTPCILQRSGINCGDKMFDHAGLTFIYSKLVKKETPITTPYDGSGNFTLNAANLKIINEKSGRYIYNVSGSGVPTNDVNRVFDFTGWASSHPGGRSAITKWSSNNYTLRYPHWSSRWNHYRNRFTEIGALGATINYHKDLSGNIKSEELFNTLFPAETTIRVDYVPIDDLGFDASNIIPHIQTRDDDMTWQAYYSTVPEHKNFLIVTIAQSTNLSGEGSVKIKSNNDENPNVSLNHFGKNIDITANRDDLNSIDNNKYINDLYNGFKINNDILTSQGYVMIQPSQTEINKEYIYENSNSIYHYHGSCSTIVDNNQKVNNYDSLYIGDISVLSKPFGGSTSFSALVTGYICSKNFYTEKPIEKPIENPIIKPSIKKILCLHGGGDSVSGLLKQTGIQNIINDLNGEYTLDFLSASGNDNTPGIWWQDAKSDGFDKGTSNDENWANDTINKINSKIINDGPYDSILGYSQGAAACIVWDAFNKEKTESLKINKLLLFCGYLPENHYGLMNVINRNSPLSTKSLIFIGNNDKSFKDLGLKIKEKMADYTELIDNNVGHYIPTKTDDTYDDVIKFIKNN